MNLHHFHPIFYAILCHSLMEFVLLHDTLSYTSCYSVLSNCYINVKSLHYHLNMNMKVINIANKYDFLASILPLSLEG